MPNRLDLLLAWRGLWQRKGLFALVVAVLSCGIGASAAVLAVIDALQLRPLPFPEPGALVQIGTAHRSRPLETEPVNRQDLLGLVADQPALRGVGELGLGTINLSDDGRPERFDGGFVSPGLFPLLGAEPTIGRGFSAADAAPGAATVVLLSDALWRTRYAADPEIVGRQVRANQRPATVVGVMPPGFTFPHAERLWLPLPVATPGDEEDSSRAVAIGRLAPGQSVQSLQAALEPRFEEARQAHPTRYEGWAVRTQPLSWFFVDWQARRGQQIMLVAVLFLLMVSALNAAGLMAAHNRGRQHEWAVREALGAGRRRRILGALAASAIVSVTSLVPALLFADWGLRWLQGQLVNAEDPAPFYLDLRISPTVLTFVFLAATGAALLGGLAPALGATAGRLSHSLREGGRGTGTRSARRFSTLAVAAQLGLSVSIVLAMAVLVQTVERMATRNLGADPAGVLTARVGLFEERYPDDAARLRFWEELQRRLTNHPAIAAATVSSVVPGYIDDDQRIWVEGQETGREGIHSSTGEVDAGFLSTYRTRLLSGRDFDDRETTESQPVAIVDQRFAAQAWPGVDPIGRRLRLDESSDRWISVVGLIETLHLPQVDDPPRGTVLLPVAQRPMRFGSIAVRSAGDPYLVAPVVREVVGGLDSELPLYWVLSHRDAIRHGYSALRIFVDLTTWLGLAALLMAGCGLYGLVATRVIDGTREIGVRRALGATAVAVARSVVRWVASPAAGGLLAGLLLSWPVARALNAIEPTVIVLGPGTYVWTLAALASAVLLAVAGPLWRALAVPPMEALRGE